VRTFESKFADALLHQHSLATTVSHAPAAAYTGRTTVLTSGTLGHAQTSTAPAPGAEEHRALLSERLLLLSGTTRGYVAAEGQCLRFLSERVEAAKTKLAACRKELLAYAALSMKVCVACILGLAHPMCGLPTFLFLLCLMRWNACPSYVSVV
jgi:hypothetical protein